jgi:hypothetical protein
MESIRVIKQTNNRNPHEFHAENIPAALKDQDAWILWHGEYNEKGKLEKTPYAVRGGMAKSTGPETWTTYDKAVEVASARNDVFGVGFVFHPESAVGGIDLDACLNPETGEIKAWAHEIIDSTPTYAEVSPSGTGVKLVGLFELAPMSGHQKILNEETGEAIEVYDRGRFFTVTGRQLPGTPSEVRNIQIPVEGVLGRYFTKPQRATAPTYAPRKLRELTEAEREASIKAIADNLPESHLNDLALDISGYLGRRTHQETIEEIMIAAWDAHGLIKHDGGGLKAIIARALERLANGENTTGGPSLEARNPEMYEALRVALGDDEKSPSGAAKEGNQAQRLISYAMEGADELFLDQNGTEHALVDGTPVPLDSGCYGWLRRLFWEHEEAAATTDLLGTVAGQLRAFAEVSEHRHTLHLRAAQHEGAVYLYLGPGRVVRVDAYGWEMDPNPPVRFRRVANLKDLPDPERGGSLDLLDAFITAQEDRDHRLAKTWLALALLADINRPILLAHGPQGATKSSVQRVLKNVIDPGRPETLKLREKDFEQNINKAFIPFFDNISTITDYMADELSKAVTGAGNAVRKLYADDEDVIREYRRAILLNGLVIPTEKADLIDRILPVALKRVPKEERETERRMRALFDERHPKLLGAVLDALSGALAYHEEVRGLPRLADWAEYAIALYKHLDWCGYDGFRDDWSVIEEGQHAVTLEGSALAQAAVAVVEEHGTVQKSPSNMLKLLHEAAESEGLNPDKDKDFPKHANWVWRKLVPVVPTLESFRITASEGKDADKKRYIRLERLDSPNGPNPEPEDEGQRNESSDSTEKMLSPSDPHTYGTETTETAETPYFSENRKYTEEQIGNTIVLQGGKNADSAVPGVGEAYLSQPEGDTISDDAVTEGGNAVTEERAGDSPKAVEARLKREQIRAAREARGEPLPESTIEKKEDGTVVLFATDKLGVGTIILELDKRDGSIGIDLETTNPETGGGALNPEDGLIRTVQVARGDFVGVVDCFYADPAPLMKFLNGEPIDIEVVKGRLEKE